MSTQKKSSYLIWIAGLILVVLAYRAYKAIQRHNELAKCDDLTQKADAAFSERRFKEAEDYYHQVVNYPGNCPFRAESSTSFAEDLDQKRDGELHIYNTAVDEKEHGFYYSALGTLDPLVKYPGELQAEVKSLKNEIFPLLAQDTGKDGQRFLLEMYETSCGLNTHDIPPLKTIVDSKAEFKYWYPEANTSDGKYIANIPAEFRIAVCYQLVQTGETVNNCVYNKGAVSVGGFGVKRATYEIELKDNISGEILAKDQPVPSKLNMTCPEVLPSLPSENVMVLDPDLATAVPWIDEQISSLK